MVTRKRVFAGLVLSSVAVVGLVVGLRYWTGSVYADRVFADPGQVPGDDAPRVAIVFGAGVRPGGRPTLVLYDRIATAADLYHRGLVSKLLLTGDNHTRTYNEPAAMRNTALALGVPDEDIVLDYAGLRTYDSCYRAAAIFGVRRAILVTQAFHLDRALYLCDSFGIDCIGVAADRHRYVGHSWWVTREFVATTAAWVNVNVLRPTPILGEPLPIGA